MEMASHMRALHEANVVRIGAARLRSELRTRRITMAQAFGDARAQPLRVGVLLAAQPGLGPEAVARVLSRAGGAMGAVNPGRRVRELTYRQRRAILRELPFARSARGAMERLP
jgi:hypothetical protein